MVVTGQRLVELHDTVFPKEPAGKIGPGSYDLRIAPDVVVYDSPSMVPELGNGKEVTLDTGGTVFKPGTFIIAHTIEYVAIPKTMSALMLLRSSTGRIGWMHAFAGYVDPGFEGQLVFELQAAAMARLVAGARIAQLILFEASDEAAYAGKYLGQVGNQHAYANAFGGGN